MGKDAGWNLLSSDRLVPQARPNKDAAWEASGVFFPTLSPGPAVPTDFKNARGHRSPSPTGDLNACMASPTTHPSAFISSATSASSYVGSYDRKAQCRQLRSALSVGQMRALGRARVLPVQRGLKLQMTSEHESPVPSWVSQTIPVGLGARLILNARKPRS